MLYNFSNVLLYNLDINVRDKQVDLRYRQGNMYQHIKYSVSVIKVRSFMETLKKSGNHFFVKNKSPVNVGRSKSCAFRRCGEKSIFIDSFIKKIKII